VQAAVEAARALPFPFMLTARAENLLWGRRDLDDTISGCKPLKPSAPTCCMRPAARLGTIRTVVSSLNRPFNLVMGFADPT